MTTALDELLSVLQTESAQAFCIYSFSNSQYYFDDDVKVEASFSFYFC